MAKTPKLTDSKARTAERGAVAKYLWDNAPVSCNNGKYAQRKEPRMERTGLLDPTEEVFGAHIDLIASGHVAVVSEADFWKRYPDKIGALIEDHRKHCPVCGELEHPRVIPPKNTPSDPGVFDNPAVRDSLRRIGAI